jgi:hypothetical protein
MTNRQLQDAIAILGVDKKQALEIVESLPDAKSPAFVEALSVTLSNANTGYAADWKGETLGLLWFAASKLVEQGQKVTVDQDRGKPTLDVAGGSYYSWQGSSKAKHNDLAAAWNAVLGDQLQLRVVTYWDQSDTQYFIGLAPRDWKQLEKLLGAVAAKLFAAPKGKGSFAKQERPPAKKIDWKKAYAKVVGECPEEDEKKFQVAKLGDKARRKLKLALEVPPRGPETRSGRAATIDEVTHLLEVVSGADNASDDFPHVPVARWFIERDPRDLATCLYARCLLTHLLFSWELYYWSWRPGHKMPEYLPRMISDPTQLALAALTLIALGCDKEAKRIAPLLAAPVIDGLWYRTKGLDDGWIALARLLLTGNKTAGLMYVDALLPLQTAAKWKQPEILSRALQVNLRSTSEYDASSRFYYKCWPPAYYALAKLAKVDVTKFNNPFVSLPADGKDIRRDVPLIQQVNGALDKFAKLKPSAFRGLRPDALTPPHLEELKALVKQRRKEGDILSCRCESIILFRYTGGPQKKVPDWTCPVCRESHMSGNRPFEVEALLAVPKDEL